MILALDVGFRSTGCAVFDKGRIIHVVTLHTEKAHKKNVRVADDTVERAALMAQQISTTYDMYNCQGVVAELPTGGSQNARAAAQMFGAICIIGAIIGLKEIPCEFCTPRDVKMAITGSAKASKEYVMRKVVRMYNWKIDANRREQNFTRQAKVVKGKVVRKRVEKRITVDTWRVFTLNGIILNKKTFEHIADAIGAYHALKNNNLVKMFG